MAMDISNLVQDKIIEIDDQVKKIIGNTKTFLVVHQFKIQFFMIKNFVVKDSQIVHHFQI